MKISISASTFFVLLLRFAMSFLMLWAFFDKTFGLGWATTAENAWIRGHSPTFGFLSHAQGPLVEVFHAMQGSMVVDWLFMMGLLGVGLAFLLGLFQRFAGYCGALMMLLMYLAVLYPENNPILDDHLIYLIVFLFLGHSKESQKFSVLKA